VLEVNHCWLGARAPDVVDVVGVADQGNDLIAAAGQDLGEAQSDLAVSSGDGYSHGLTLRASFRLPARNAVARLGCEAADPMR
jgi:hypothetical protein